MAEALKILGQAAPGAGTLTDLYTVPASTQAVGSSFVVCNRNDYTAHFSMAVAVAGAADTEKQYHYWEQEVPANETFIATIGMTLAATDVVRVLSLEGGMSFNLHGTENT